MAGPPPRDPALSFGGVADVYDRSRPGYPADAVSWLVGEGPAEVLELGAGTGKLTEELLARGHRVVATDPDADMLRRLAQRVPAAAAVRASAERIPLPDGSVDVVVAAQAFHWFDHDRALSECARVLRPGGALALVWNLRDERIPWVRRLGRVIGTQEQETDPTQTLLASRLFGFVEQASFRFWQPLDRDLLRDLVRSRSNVAVLAEPARAALLAEVDALYDDYGRGHDGMLLPYLTRCFRTVVRAREEPTTGPARGPEQPGDEGPDLLIDFR